jgi:hypothetical protein
MLKLIIITHIIHEIGTNSMKKNNSLEANSRSASQEIYI